MAITPLPALDRTSSTFKADVDLFFASQVPGFAAEANVLQADVNAKQAAAAASASAASTSASNSANSATNSATSATNASTSSTNAAYSAEAAANSAANAATGAANAKIHADRLLASSATAPTTRGDGTPLQIGDRYVNTGSQAEYIYKSFGWVSNDSMVAIDELQGSLADPDDGPRIIAFRQGGSSPVTKDTYEKISSTVSIRDFGSVFDGAASNTSALQNACNRCVSLGISVLMVDVPFVNLLSDVDCKNVRLQCSETKFVGVGRLNNNAGIIGGYIAGIAQDEVFKAPAGMLCAKSSMKILYKASANEMWLLAKKARNGGYFRTRILWNSFLVEGSVAGQSELWRCAQVQNLATVYGYKKTATNKVGTWTDLDIPLSSGGTGRPYKVNVTSTLNDYIEYSFSGNEVSLGLYQSSGSTTGATVQIDGVTVETINLQQATAGVLIKRYFTTTGGAHTLRITRTLGGGTMYVAGSCWRSRRSSSACSA